MHRVNMALGEIENNFQNTYIHQLLDLWWKRVGIAYSQYYVLYIACTNIFLLKFYVYTACIELHSIVYLPLSSSR